MEEIKQLHQSLELNLDRLEQTLNDLRRTILDQTAFQDTKMFKVGELTSLIGVNLEDLKLDLDELSRAISKQKAEPVKTPRPNVLDDALKKALREIRDKFEKEVGEKMKYDYDPLDHYNKEGFTQSPLYKDILSPASGTKPYNLGLDTGSPLNKSPFYTTTSSSNPGGGTITTVSNGENFTYAPTPEPPKEFTSGYSEVQPESCRTVDSTWHVENGVNYQLVTKHNDKTGYKTEMYVSLSSKNLSSAEECIDIIKSITEKSSYFKWLPFFKRSVVAYVSEESFKNIHKDIIKEFRGSDFIKTSENNNNGGVTKITSTSLKKYIILNHQLGVIKIEAV